MGYNTFFFGSFSVTPALTPAHAAYLKRFSEVRHMKRYARLLGNAPDPLREAVGITSPGVEGAFYTGSPVAFGQDYDSPSVADTNEQPTGQPSLWCHWAPCKDGRQIAWNGGEKFYDYSEWLEYLVEHFLAPWGYTLEGTVKWVGEDLSDQGTLYVAENEVFVLPDAEITTKEA
jgi:hypothetical protein